MRLVANAYGRRKALRFRARFRLSTAGFASLDADYADVHDYAHTLLGALPGLWDDESRVLDLEQAILDGRVALPRGLEIVP